MKMTPKVKYTTPNDVALMILVVLAFVGVGFYLVVTSPL